MELNTKPLKFTLLGQMPSGKGQIRTQVVRGGIHRFPNKRFELWRSDAFRQLAEQRGGRTTIDAPCAVDVLYIPGDRIRRDVPGIMDALCHLLEWCPIHGKKKTENCNQRSIADDSQLHHWNWKRGNLDRERPRIEVTITPYEVALASREQVAKAHKI